MVREEWAPIESNQNKTWIIVAIMLAMFLAALDTTIVGTAMPSIISDLHGISIYSWVFSVYLLTSTTPIPVYGKLADIYGRKIIFLISIVIFIAGSLLCGFAADMPQLIIFRAVQGLGAAGVLPVALTLAGDLFTLEQRARVQGFFSAVWATSAIVGPLLGAVIVESASWRWVFWINLPIGLVALVVLTLTFREKVTRRPHTIDWPGAILLTIAAGLLLYALTPGGLGWSPSPATLLPLLASLALFGTLTFWESRAKEPVLPLSLFRDPFLVAINAANFVAGMAYFGLITYLPLFVQGVLGGTPTAAGQTLTPMMLGWPLAAFLVGRFILRFGPRPVAMTGAALIICGASIIAINPNLPSLYLNSGSFLTGIGLGLLLTGLLIYAQNATPWERRGVVTASIQFFRTIGGAIGVSLLGAILNVFLGASTLLRSVDVTRAGTQLLSPQSRRQMDPLLRLHLSTALGGSLHVVFISILICAIVVFGVTLFLPKASPETT